MYVVYGDTAALTAGVRARAYAPDGTPFGPPVTIATQIPTREVRTTRLPNGDFANAWMSIHTAFANVVSLCPSASATCGDGVLVPACERCDAGPGNDDGAPNACRTTCLPAHCGDGTVDAGEECDDGNALLLDGCTPGCTLERIQSGGSTESDCLAEWAIDNPTTVPARDKRGGINPRQRCVDDDARCDFDGGTPGSCTFHLRACGNNTDILGCRPPSRLSAWVVDKPSVREGNQRPALAAVRDLLHANVPGALVGPNTPDVCGAVLPVIVPLRVTPAGAYKPGKLILQTHATSYENVVDKDKIRLDCVPAN